jgi:sulfite exporter TauE/SafE
MNAAVNAGLGGALALGLATGPVCVATCGPVVLPWMLAQPQGMWRNQRQLVLFLTARLAGYLLFAVAVWLAGEAVPRAWMGRSWLFGGLDVLIAAALLGYAARWPRRHRPQDEKEAPLVQIGVLPLARAGAVLPGETAAGRRRGALALGFLTGVNFCPPFLAAGAQAAQLGSLAGALWFFTVFFVGTAVWFLPLAGLGLWRKAPVVVLVARMTAGLVACWYGISGVSILIERMMHG